MYVKKKADKDDLGKKEVSVSKKSKSKRNLRKEIQDSRAKPLKPRSQGKRRTSPKSRVSRVSKPKKKSPRRSSSRDR